MRAVENRGSPGAGRRSAAPDRDAHARRFVSLGTKLVVGMMAIVAAVSILVFYEMTARERRHLIDAKALAASMVADLFALGLAAPLDFRDADAVATELSNLRQNGDVVYAAAWLADGSEPFAETATPPDPAEDHARPRLTVERDRVEVVRLVRRHDGKPIGSAVVHLSLAREDAAYRATLARTIPVGVLAGLGMLSLLVLLVRRQILGPLGALADAAGQVERGEAGAALAVRSNDEIGHLARAFNAMSEAIFDREARLSAANSRLEELFDNMREGIVVFGPDGRVTGAASRRASLVFADRGGDERPVEGARVVDLLYPEAFEGDPEAAALDQWIALAFDLSADRWDEIAELAPKEALLFAGGPAERLLELEVRPIVDGDRLSRVMLLVTDATERRRLLREVRSQGEQHEREMAALRRLYAGGAQAFVDFLASARDRLDRCAEILSGDPPSIGELLQHVHTMKGEARAFDLRELAAHLGALEDTIAAAVSPDPRDALRRGLDEAAALLGRARQTFVAVSPLGDGALDQATVRRRDLGILVELAGQRDDELGRVVRRLASRRFGEATSILAEQAPTWAEALDKRAILRVEGREVLVPPRLARVLGAVLTHVVKNAIAHGIEAPADREQLGKDATGEIVLRCTEAGEEGPVIVVEDDGRGLSRDAIVARAKALGLDADAPAEGLIFHPGFSTAPLKSEAAGLGVGLAAARADLAQAGYRIRVEDRPTGGTRFVLTASAGEV